MIVRQDRCMKKQLKKLLFRLLKDSIVSFFFFIVFGTSTPCLVIINRKLFMYQLASVLAYGQTSSGKTYTMTGITEYAIADIYEYVHKVTIGSIVNCCLLRVLALLY